MREHIMNITLNEEAFIVTDEWYALIRELAIRAQKATTIEFPDSCAFVSVRLVNIGVRVIPVIKEVRALSGMNLRESKDFVDSVRNTGTKRLLCTRPYAEAQKVANAFHAVGATTDLPGPLEWLAQQAE